MNNKNYYLLTLLLLALFFNATAQTIIDADVADNTITKDKTSYGGDAYTSARINYNKDHCYVIPFKIPVIPVGQEIIGASLEITLLKYVKGNGTTDIDLYGIDFRNSSTVNLINDYFSGANDANSSKLQEAILVTTSSIGLIKTSTAGSNNLVTYINNQIKNGAKSGDFIFLRLSPDNTGSYHDWVVGSANSVDVTKNPHLILTYGASSKPVFVSKLNDKVVNEGATINLDISATDPNGDNLNFTAKNLPTFAKLNSNVNGTASITVSPKTGDAGTYNDIEITVSDGTNTDVQTFSITVKDPNFNTAPVIVAVTNQILQENTSKIIDITVTDAESNIITISINNKPKFAILKDVSNGVAQLVLTPLATDVGVYNDIEIVANDGKVSTSEKFNIEVTDTPIFTGNSYYCDPVNGSMNNDGSEASPWSSLQDVFGRKKLFNGGDVIYLLSGKHGSPFMNGVHDDYVTIMSATGHEPVIAGVQIENGSYYAFDGVTFSSDGSGGNFAKDYMISTSKTFTHLKVVNCTFHSGTDSSNWTKADWYAKSKDAVIIRGSNIIFNNNTIKNTYFALQIEGDYAEVKSNLIDNFGADAIRALSSNAIYSDNVIRDAYVEDYGINHDDAIQMYDKDNVTSGVVDNLIISNNKIYNFADNITDAMVADNLVGYSMQGIIVTDGHIENSLIENNLSVTDHYHGITLSGAVNCRVQNNTVLKTPTSHNPVTDAIPWIRFAKSKQNNYATNCVMRNNIASNYVFWEFDDNETSGFDKGNVRENNINLKTGQEGELNIANYFTDYNNLDFTLIEGSPAIDAGTNKDLSSTDINGEIRKQGDSVDCGAHEFYKEKLKFERNEVLSITAYPNPVLNNTFKIKTPNNKSVYLRVLSINGQVVYLSTVNNNETVELPENIAKGVYILEVDNNTRTKLIVN